MILNFSMELKKIVEHSDMLYKKYDLTVSCKGKVPKEHETIHILFEEDMEKIIAICNAADELDKRNKELEKLVKSSGLEDSFSYYYPLGGGKI